MTGGGAVLIGFLGVAVGYIARGFDRRSHDQRPVLRPFGPPRSHCRLRPAPYDQDRDHGLG